MSNTVIKERAASCATHLSWRSAAAVVATTSMLVGCGSDDSSSVDRDVLRLHFVDSTMPGYRGIPDEVFQRALYMTATFTRTG